MNALNNVDLPLTKFIFSLLPHTILINKFFSFFSLEGNSFFIWILIIAVVIIIEEKVSPGIQKKDINFILYFIVSFAVTFVLVNYVLKNITHRSRPTISLSSHCPKDYSFPSSHAATAFAAATILANFDRKRRWFYYLTAFLISLSRIYLGCHYLFDVVSGAIIGIIISRLLLLLDKKDFKLP